MNKITELIWSSIKKGECVLLVGGTGIGKSYYINNELTPFLMGINYKVNYYSDSLMTEKISEDCDILILDEFETLFDKEYLEKNHPEENPYYEKKYVQLVKSCQEKVKYINKPIIFVVTRNTKDEIEYLAKNIKKIGSGQKVKVVVFEK